MKERIDHLQLIQSVITRMASNSFALKGWAVTLAAGIFALSSKDSDKMYFLVAYLPCFMFWFLDSYYLRQERLFRALYDKVRKASGEVDFSMNTSMVRCDETLSCEQKEKLRYSNCLCSLTEICFYVPLLIVCTGVILLNNWNIVKNIIAGNWRWFLLPFVILFVISIVANRKNLRKKIDKKRPKDKNPN